MGRKAVLGFLLILLLGCSSVSQIDGRLWEHVSCGSNKGWGVCMNAAANACPKGFDIRRQDEDIITQKRGMEFACK